MVYYGNKMLGEVPGQHRIGKRLEKKLKAQTVLFC